jgi:hypothetical protein
MIDVHTLEPGTVIQFKKNTDQFPHLVNPDWIGKRLKFLGMAKRGCISYMVLEDINSGFKKGYIHNDIQADRLIECMEIVGERKSHLPSWW